MTKKKKKKKKPINPPSKLELEDEVGKIEINMPSLIALFWSDDLQEEFEKNPNETYSVKDLVYLTENAEARPKEATIRSTFFSRPNKIEQFFEQKGKEIRGQDRLDSVNVGVFTNIARKVVNYCKRKKEEMRQEYENQ